MKKRSKTLLIWLVLVTAFLLLFVLRSGDKPANVDFPTFLRLVESGLVSEVRVNNNEITFTDQGSGMRLRALGVMDEELQQKLSEQGVTFEWGEERDPLRSVLIFGVPLILLLAFFIYFMRKSQGGMGNVMTMMKSRAREISSEASQVTFADVGGCEEAKALLGDVIDFLKHPRRWTDAGARLPRGVLLEGPPGCGKTLLARAVAGETDAKFFLVSASEFVEMFVGVGAARVRDMFETAAKQAPAVIFIDELDAVGRRRGSGIGAAHDEREQTLNQLLVCLDGFQANDRVVVIGATNRPDVLDQALLRSGRIDRRIKIPPLTPESRLEILLIHTRNKPVHANVDLREVARSSQGFNGAQLENLANEAALLAVRRARQQDGTSPEIRQEDFERALHPVRTQERRFDKLDSLLIESASQLSEPTGAAHVRLTLKDGQSVEGEVVWADSAFIKLQRAGEDSDLVIPKLQIHKLEALSGTEAAGTEDIVVDQWATRLPDLA